MTGVVWMVALRHLRSGSRQTALTVGVVAISVTVMIVLGGLIAGLQARLISSVTGSIPHVVVRQGPRDPRAATDPAGATLIERSVPIEQVRRKVEDWQALVADLPERVPHVIGVSPVVEGQGFLTRGARRQPVSITGVIPERHNRVIDLESKRVAGRFLDLGSGEMAIGVRLASDLRVQMGDKLRLTSSEGVTASFTIGGIFDSGFRAVDDGAVYLNLRDAQSLFALGTAVTSIGIKLDQLYDADDIADRLAAQLPYEVRSWMRDNQQLLLALRMQTTTTGMIRLSTVIAAAFSIASILFMAVATRRREIGILKAMGSTRRQIVGIFSVQGLLIGVIGALAGCGAGVSMALYMGSLRSTSMLSGKVEPMLPVIMDGWTIGMPMAIAVIIGLGAALYPARQAARIEAIDAIRSG